MDGTGADDRTPPRLPDLPQPSLEGHDPVPGEVWTQVTRHCATLLGLSGVCFFVFSLLSPFLIFCFACWNYWFTWNYWVDIIFDLFLLVTHLNGLSTSLDDIFDIILFYFLWNLISLESGVLTKVCRYGHSSHSKACTHMNTSTHWCMNTSTHRCMHSHIHKCLSTCVYTHTHTHTHTHTN